MDANIAPQFVHWKQVIPEADLIFTRLRDEVQWNEIVWRRGRKLPRLCARSVQQTEVGALLAEWLVMFFRVGYGVVVNISDIFGNHYRTGNDWLPHHRDQYDDLHVVSLSFGATRKFSLTPSLQKGVKAVAESVPHSFDLSAGDIFIFDPTTNHHYTHGIAKQPGVKTARINLTCFVHFNKLPYQLPRLGGEILSPSEVFVLAMIEAETNGGEIPW